LPASKNRQHSFGDDYWCPKNIRIYRLTADDDSTRNRQQIVVWGNILNVNHLVRNSNSLLQILLTQVAKQVWAERSLDDASLSRHLPNTLSADQVFVT